MKLRYNAEREREKGKREKINFIVA